MKVLSMDEVTLTEDTVKLVFNTHLDSLRGGRDVYLNHKTGAVEASDDWGRGTPGVEAVNISPSETQLAALKLRTLLRRGTTR